MFDRSALRGRTLSHAYILTGGSEERRRAAALDLAAALVCSAGEGERPCGVCLSCKKAAAGIHPDVITITGAGDKPINVNQVRTLRADAYVRPNEAQRKVYLLERADDMNDSAQNAMLKLLEEGPPYAAFLLLCAQSGKMLSTVRSRCELLRLEEDAPPECPPEVKEAGDRLCSLYCSGDEGGFLAALIPCEKWEREDLQALLEELVARFRERLVACPGEEETRRLLHGVDTAEKLRLACGYNAAVGHLCGWLAGALFSP